MDLSELYKTYDRIRKNQASPRQMLKIVLYPEDIRKAKKRLKEIEDADWAIYERSKQLEEKFAKFFYDASQDLKERFDKLHPDGLRSYAPDEMFTAEEIGAFIRENYPEQKT